MHGCLHAGGKESPTGEGQPLTAKQLRFILADEFKNLSKQFRCDLRLELGELAPSERRKNPSKEQPTMIRNNVKFHATEEDRRMIEQEQIESFDGLTESRRVGVSKRVSPTTVIENYKAEGCTGDEVTSFGLRMPASQHDCDSVKDSMIVTPVRFFSSELAEEGGQLEDSAGSEPPSLTRSTISGQKLTNVPSAFSQLTASLSKKKDFAGASERAFALTNATTRDFDYIKAEGRGDEFSRYLKMIVLSTRFELLTLVFIILNAALVGIQTNHMATNNLVNAPVAFRVLEISFCIFFTLEIIIRMLAHRWRYFTMWGWGWNVFDLLLVVIQIAEEILHAIAGPATLDIKSMMSSVILRVVRVLRVVKLIRVLRVMRFTEDLRLLVSCMLYSMRSFFWAFILLLLVLYVAATYCVQVVFVACQGPGIPPESVRQLRRFFGSVPRAVLSLFQGLTGGVDWNDLVEPLMDYVSPLAGVAFFLYSSFAILALMNIVTGIFVHSAMDRATSLQESNKVSRVKKMFKSLDLDDSGFITSNEIVNHLESPAVQEYFRSIGVDESEALSVFEILDHDGSGAVTLEEFLGGCMRLQGPARNFDLVLVTRESRRAFDVQTSILQSIEQQLDRISAK